MVIGVICVLIGFFFVARGFMALNRKKQSSKTNKEKSPNIVLGDSLIYIGFAGIIVGILFIT
jgi:multisubunit Na+/H+ antiporter MnhG subunit